MKRFTLTIIIVSFVLLSGCSKSGSGTGGTGTGGGTGNPPFVPNCTGVTSSFATDVSPIFQSICSQSGCHNPGSVNGPGALTNYTEISSAKSLIRGAIISGAMPKTGSLTSAQKNAIICWIDAGAANN